MKHLSIKVAAILYALIALCYLAPPAKACDHVASLVGQACPVCDGYDAQNVISATSSTSYVAPVVSSVRTYQRVITPRVVQYVPQQNVQIEAVPDAPAVAPDTGYDAPGHCVASQSVVASAYSTQLVHRQAVRLNVVQGGYRQNVVIHQPAQNVIVRRQQNVVIHHSQNVQGRRQGPVRKILGRILGR